MSSIKPINGKRVMKNYTFAEILQYSAEGKNRKERAERLLEFDSAELRQFLFYMYCPNFKFVIDSVDYKPSGCIPGNAFTTIKRRMDTIKRIACLEEQDLDDVFDVIPDVDIRVIRFVELCESVSDDEAKLLEAVLQKKSGITGFTKAVVQQAYPGLVEGECNDVY